MGAGGSARQDRGVEGLYRYDFHARLLPLERLANAGDGAASADPGHEHIDLTVGIAPDFLCRGLAVDLRVRRILELAGNEGRRGLLRQFLRAAYGRPSCLRFPASEPAPRRGP